MLTVSEAIHATLGSAHDLGTETVEIQDASGRILREFVLADRDYPPINRATMDGMAINHTSWIEGQRSWTIEATIPAGVPARELKDISSGCVQIMTGAELPGNCGGIIPYEDVTIEGDQATAKEGAVFEPGQFIHVKSSDKKDGDQVLWPDAKLTPPRMAIMAAMGHTRVTVANRPRVAVVSTGDEIVPITQQTLEPAQTRASNLTGVVSALNLLGIDHVTAEHIVDDPDETTARIKDLTEQHDILILSGGVSKGKFDYVPDALDRCGVRKVFHRVSQKPGKPLWFGYGSNCTVFGLPGNPIATLTMMRRYVEPYIIKTSGCEVPEPLHLGLSGTIKPHEKLTLFLPVRIVTNAGEPTLAQPVKYQGSGDFTALAESDGFIEVPPGSTDEIFPYYEW